MCNICIFSAFLFALGTLNVPHTAGDGRFPDHQHADGAAQLLPGAAAVLLSERGSGGAAAGPPDSPESHRPARQRRQVLQHKVSWENISITSAASMKLSHHTFSRVAAQHHL